MPSIIKDSRSVFENRKKELDNFDFHSLTEICGLKMKNLAVSDEQISQSRSTAEDWAATFCAKLAEVAGNRTPSAEACRAPANWQWQGRKTGHGVGQAWGGGDGAANSPPKHLSNADFATFAKMQQIKWLAARSRPPPKREFPFKESPKRADIVRHFREAADRYADQVMKIHRSKIAGCDPQDKAVPFDILTYKDLLKYENNFLHGTASSGYATGLSSNDMSSSLLQKDSAASLDTLGPKELIKESVSAHGVNISKDSSDRVLENQVVNNKTKSKPKDTKIRKKKNDKKYSLTSKKELLNSKTSKSSIDIPDIYSNKNRIETIQKRFQDICQQHKIFLKECDRILTPSNSDFRTSSQSQKSNISQMEKNTSKPDISNYNPHSFKESHRFQPTERTPFFQRPRNIHKKFLQLENQFPTDINDRNGTNSSGINSEISLLSLSPKNMSLQGSQTETTSSLEQKRTILSHTQQLQDNEKHDSSSNIPRSKLADDVFSWKSARKKNKRFSPDDFRAEVDDVSLQLKPIINLKFPSDNKREGQDIADKSIPHIKLKKSTIKEVQVPTFSQFREKQTNDKIKEEDYIQKLEKRENISSNITESMIQRFLREKRSQKPNAINVSSKNMKQKIDTQRDGVELRLHRIPEAIKGNTKGMNTRMSAINHLGDDKESPFAIQPKAIEKLKHMASLRGVRFKQ